jgi:hypothetical protein
MNRELAMKVANAVLYEGYMLYPYRPSAIKNQQRWSFGILYPPQYHEVGLGTERAEMHSECLVKVTGSPVLHVQLRFLQLLPGEDGEEGLERSFDCELSVGTAGQHSFHFVFAPEGVSGGRRQVKGTIAVSIVELTSQLVKLALTVANTTAFAGEPSDRNSALLVSLFSAHTILSITGGEFVSLIDPPDELRAEVNACKNVGIFPVLVCAEGERDMMLCSPIVLYDYPQIAPESAGDFFDGTEMDEMLTLRVMTLTDDEKNQMRSGDGHVRELLQRTEASAREQLARTHGTIRSLRQVEEP